MADREKVIKALQNCSVQNDVGCQCCPYFEERKTYGHEWCTTSMAQDALELLKEQEAVVRCKDCKRHIKPGDCDYGNKPDDWFCADGERRTD